RTVLLMLGLSSIAFGSLGLGCGKKGGASDGPAPADLGCLGQREAPRPGPTTELTYPAISFGQVDDMGEPLAVPGLQIQIFPDNVIPASEACEGNCSLAEDLGDGRYRFRVPGDAWFAYRVLERDAEGTLPAVLRTMEVNADPSPTEFFGTFFVPVLEGLYQSLSVPQDEARATLAGRFADCNGDWVEGATVTLANDEGVDLPYDETTFPLYLDPLPNPALTATGPEGRYAVTNVPPGDGWVQVRVWAPNGVLVGCERVAVAANAQSGSRVRPLGIDAPCR
ncbi:MAG: hypothetical protein AAFV01_15030, partial [Bacteroidota bacterium]